MGDIFVACSVRFDVGGKGCCYTFCVLSQDLPIPSSREDNWNYTKSGLSLNSFPTPSTAPSIYDASSLLAARQDAIYDCMAWLDVVCVAHLRLSSQALWEFGGNGSRGGGMGAYIKRV